MSEDSRYALNEDGIDTSRSSAQDNAELDKLQKKLTELRRQGILIGGYGSWRPLRPVAHVPGGLARFLDDRE